MAHRYGTEGVPNNDGEDSAKVQWAKRMADVSAHAIQQSGSLRQLGVERHGSGTNLTANVTSTPSTVTTSIASPIAISLHTHTNIGGNGNGNSGGGSNSPRLINGGRSTPPPSSAAMMLGLAGGSPSSKGGLAVRLVGQDSFNRPPAAGSSTHATVQHRNGSVTSIPSMNVAAAGGLGSPSALMLSAPTFGGMNGNGVGHKNSRRPSVNDWKPFASEHRSVVMSPGVDISTNGASGTGNGATLHTPRTHNNSSAHRHGERGGVGGVGAFGNGPSSHVPSHSPNGTTVEAHASGNEKDRDGRKNKDMNFDTFSGLGRPSSTEVVRRKLQGDRQHTRDDPRARRISHVMKSKVYLFFNIFFTLVSLFARDFTVAFLPVTWDDPTAIILLILFALFAIEIIINCYVRVNYFNSFFFWLDVIGIITMLYDVQVLSELFFASSGAGSNGGSSSREGVGNRVTRSAGILRVAKFARIIRIIRLVRVVRIFKFRQQSRKAHPSKVGLHLAELIDKRVIVMLLGSLCIVPLLANDPPYGASQALGLDMLERSTRLDNSTRATLATAYVSFHTSCLYLNVDGISVMGDPNGAANLRSLEYDIYTTAIGPAGTNSMAMISVRDDVFTEALYNMAILLFIILMFAIGSFVISKDVHVLVVAPLDRTTQVIKKLAGTICFLQQTPDEELKLVEKGYETNVIESIIERMAQIFSVEPDHSGSLDKPMQMMTGSKHTEIKTLNTVVSIEVIERPRQHEPAVADLPEDDFMVVDLNKHHELASLENILSNHLVLPHFKMFMTSHLLAENLLFWQEVERYRTIVRLHTSRLFAAFIAPDSSNEINVRQGIADRIKEQLEDPRSSIFDEAQDDIFKLMNVNAYKPFLQSKFCQAYLWKREGKVKPKNTGGNKGELHTPDIPGRVHHGQTHSLPPLARTSSNSRTTAAAGTAATAATITGGTKDNIGVHTTFHGSPHSTMHGTSSGPTAIVIPVSPPPHAIAGNIGSGAGNDKGAPFGHVSIPSSPNIPASPNPTHPPHHPSTALHHHTSPPNLTVTIAGPGANGNGNGPSSPIPPPSVITAGTTVPSRPGSATGIRSASVAAGGAVVATKHLTVGSLAMTRLESPTSPSVGSGMIGGSLATHGHHHTTSSFGGMASRPLFVNATASAAINNGPNGVMGTTIASTTITTVPQLSPAASAASASSPSASTVTAMATTSPTNTNTLNRLSSLPPLPDINQRANANAKSGISAHDKDNGHTS